MGDAHRLLRRLEEALTNAYTRDVRKTEEKEKEKGVRIDTKTVAIRRDLSGRSLHWHGRLGGGRQWAQKERVEVERHEETSPCDDKFAGKEMIWVRYLNCHTKRSGGKKAKKKGVMKLIV